jgi:oxygen-independent coproporphyrinogen-3 oxidase
MKSHTGVNISLIKKYNLPVPRYTSYPTVPFWEEQIENKHWKNIVAERFAIENSEKGISIYIHLPFCESLCTYCGCNKKITGNHSVEEGYINALNKEWSMYRLLMKEQPVIRELHLGGGTPTFFSAENLQRIIDIVLEGSNVHAEHEFSIEGHPNNTTTEQLEVLYKNGFRRISFGVQDNDPEVQRIISRMQPFENVVQATKTARAIGFDSLNFDLIYGLPKQTLESIERTFNQVLQLMPDRIAYYSYAHVPWTSKAQRLFDEQDLPEPEQKLALYIRGKEMLLEKGYTDIGMDHFALPGEALCNAKANGKLHRNFMGYTTQHSGMLIGLGVSAISDAGTAFAQNEKTLHDYYHRINHNELPVKKGYFLNSDDLIFRKHILNLSCKGKTDFCFYENNLLQQYAGILLQQLQDDGLIHFTSQSVSITQLGHYFIRNICSAFDMHLERNKYNQKPVYSKAV